MSNVLMSTGIVLLLVFTAIEAGARDGQAVWDSRCEQCHGDADQFARKYLWNMDGKLQGQHRVDNLQLFLSNHYVPGHLLETIHDMLMAEANSPFRYTTECSECHGDLAAYVDKTFWVGATSITVTETGMDAAEFLQDHRQLQPEDVTFYLRLFSRIAGSPLPLKNDSGLKFR